MTSFMALDGVTSFLRLKDVNSFTFLYQNTETSIHAIKNKSELRLELTTSHVSGERFNHTTNEPDIN